MKASSHLLTKFLQKSLVAHSIALFGDIAFFEPQMRADQRGWTQMDESELALTH